MNIGKNWKIGSDSLNIILYRKRKRGKKDTKEVYEDWETAGYFATIAGALHELINQEIRDTHLTDLKTIATKIEKLETLLDPLSKRLRAMAEASK